MPSAAYYAALEQVHSQARARDNALNWELAGPTHVSGRITDVAMHHTDLQTIYAASASGGVWKSNVQAKTGYPLPMVVASSKVPMPEPPGPRLAWKTQAVSEGSKLTPKTRPDFCGGDGPSF